MTTTVEVLPLESKPPIWLTEALQKLDDLAALDEDWDSYGGKPLSPAIYNAASMMLASLEFDELPVPCVTLCSAGTVQLEWQLNGRELEVEVVSPTRLRSLRVFPDGTMDEQEIAYSTTDALRHRTRWLVRN